MTRTRWGFLVLAAGVVACSPGDCPAPPATVLGKWTYSAHQTAPAATLNGTLTIDSGCPGFQGTLDGNQSDGLGGNTQVHAIIAGQMVGTAGVRFDADERLHYGSIVNDSMSGTWFDQSSGANGPFTAVKE